MSIRHTVVRSEWRCSVAKRHRLPYLAGLVLQISHTLEGSFATHYRALLQKMTCNDEASYECSPHCNSVLPGLICVFYL